MPATATEARQDLCSGSGGFCKTQTDTDPGETMQNKVESVSSIIETSKNTETVFWFRGHRKASWPLLPAAFRDDVHPILEAEMAKRFKMKAQIFYRECPGGTEYQKWLPLMQHYGLPTRLLDWSESPLVALFFAVEKSDKKEDAAIYFLDSGTMNEVLHSAPIQIILGDSPSNKINEVCERAFINKDSDVGQYPPFAVVIAQKEYRMLNQMSCFTLHDERKDLNEYAQSARYLSKLIIPKECIDNIRNELTILGIRRSILFPDLTNLAEELRRLVAISDKI